MAKQYAGSDVIAVATAEPAAGAEAGGGSSVVASLRQVVPLEVEVTDTSKNSFNAATATGGGTGSTFAKLLFLLHLLGFASLVAYLAVKAWSHQALAQFFPLLTSVGVSVLAAAVWLNLALIFPQFATKASFVLAPLFTLGFAVVIILIAHTAFSCVLGLLAMATAVAMTYNGWILAMFFLHGNAIMTDSLAVAHLSDSAGNCVTFTMLASAAYVLFWALGVSCAAMAEDHLPRFTPACMVTLMLSLIWTMQVAFYVVYVAIARLAHPHLVSGEPVPGGACVAFCSTLKGLALGEICVGAVPAAVATAVRTATRVATWPITHPVNFVLRNQSLCPNCCLLVVQDALVMRANRWGFVHVGVQGKGFWEASRDVCALFKKREMEIVLNTDITSSLFFCCGITVGTVAALVAGPWAMAMDKSHREHALPVATYAFLIGYYLCRITMAWPQACVAAFHVAYAENPENPRLGTLIPDQKRWLSFIVSALTRRGTIRLQP